jgi:hypothetical protein
VPALADQGLYIGSENSFYRVLHAHGQAHRRARARPPQEPRRVPRLRASGPNQVWSWNITYLPTTVRGIWQYLYLVIDVWSRKVVAWDVDEREDPVIAVDLVSRACLCERISKRRRQPLILHADNGNAMRAATLEPPGRTGRAQVFLTATGVQRQALLRIAVQNGEVSARLPPQAFYFQRAVVPVGLTVRRLV